MKRDKSKYNETTTVTISCVTECSDLPSKIHKGDDKYGKPSIWCLIYSTVDISIANVTGKAASIFMDLLLLSGYLITLYLSIPTPNMKKVDMTIANSEMKPNAWHRKPPLQDKSIST